MGLPEAMQKPLFQEANTLLRFGVGYGLNGICDCQNYLEYPPERSSREELHALKEITSLRGNL